MEQRISDRMALILKAIPTDRYVTSAELADAVDLSEKTVRTAIGQLRDLLDGSGAQVLSKTRMGYTLQIDDPEQYDRFLADLFNEEAPKVPGSTRERIRYLVWDLLKRSDYVKIDTLCEDLFIARSSLTQDLRKVERLFAEYNITLVRRPNYGIKLQGQEFDFRNCMINRILHAMELGDESFTGRHRETLDKIHDILLEQVQKNGLFLSQTVFQNQVVSIFTVLYRLRLSRYIFLPQEDVEQTIGEETRSIARDIAKAMEEAFGLPIPQAEVDYIAINLAGKCNYNTFTGDCCQAVPGYVEELAHQMLEEVYETFHLDVRKDLDFLMFLTQHLFPMIIRLKYHIFIKNDMKEDVKAQYPFPYMVASQAVIPLKIAYRVDVPEDEIAYFASLFAMALERARETVRKKNILIICSAAMSSARLLAYQYKQEFQKYVDEVHCCDIYNVDQMDFSRIDYVFTTVPLKKKLPRPVIEIKAFLDPAEIGSVKTTLELGSASAMTNYYSPELFISHVKGGSKEEVLDSLCQQIRKFYPLPKNFYQAVLRREELASTDFGNRVALPHPYKAMTQNTFVCVSLLDQPITWVRNEVQVVILVSIAPDEDRDLQSFYRTTTQLVQDRKAVDELIAQPDYGTLIRLLSRDQSAGED